MKKAKQIFATFLAIYMVALFVLPCHDTCNAKVSDVTTTINHDQNHQSQDNDICSPFCSCSCCATHIVVQHYADFLPNNLFFTQEFNFFYQSFSSYTYYTIWQPPKLT